MAAELRTVGVDFSFAPVLDLDRGLSRVIGDRGFTADPQAVSELAASWMRGARQAGMASVGKHFPGMAGSRPIRTPRCRATSALSSIWSWRIWCPSAV
jgi:beta-N-acetylhexosaminidase